MPATHHIDVENAPEHLRTGLRFLFPEYTPLSPRPAPGLTSVSFRHDPALVAERAFVIRRSTDRTEIRYGRRIEAFRALGRLMAGFDGDELRENCRFEMLSLQLESSRNGVITPANVQAFIRRASLMGINTLMLYLEDTYEVPGEPFFGYLRGKHSQGDLKNLDDYADAFGIEMVPCIQALGHLHQILQWKNAYADVTDIPGVLLANEEKTYELVGRMIDAARAPFRSNRIHLGMDEAVGMGTGQYKRRFGERPVFDVMNDHLARVAAMCEERGLQPMIWSDMYFRIASETHQYYDLDAHVPPETIARIPANVDLVYWDYYHTEQSFYETYIDRHRAMNKEPIMAPGAWNWSRFWTHIPYSLARVLPCMEACKAKNLRQVFMTTWGDDGMECDVFSVLPVIQAFADVAYGETFDEATTARNFAASCLADYHDYSLASRLDLTGPGRDPNEDFSNCSKWMMWDDPLIGLCEPHQEMESGRAHFHQLAEELDAAARKENPGADRLRFPAQIARVLALKCDLRKNLVKAYRTGDKEKLRALLEQEAQPLREELEKLWKIHRSMWLATYRPFGLEVIELRYGGLIARVRSLIDRVENFCDGEIEAIPEFETELLPWASGQNLGHYRRHVTPSAIS